MQLQKPDVAKRLCQAVGQLLHRPSELDDDLLFINSITAKCMCSLLYIVIYRVPADRNGGLVVHLECGHRSIFSDEVNQQTGSPYALACGSVRCFTGQEHHHFLLRRLPVDGTPAESSITTAPRRCSCGRRCPQLYRVGLICQVKIPSGSVG
jgi:hypothetical protein